MIRSTLPRHARTRAHAPGWAHPYADPFTLYADGGEGDEDGAEGEEKPDGEEPAEEPDGEEPDPDGTDELGDKGKRALASMKGKWRTERNKRKELEDQLAAAAADDEAATARREAEQAALAKANARIVRAEVRVAAKGVLADPADALKFLDLDQFEVDENGDLDSEEVTEAINELIKTKPYLAAATAKRFQGTGDGGAARKAGRPKQLTRQDLKTMSAEAIDKAREDGRLDDLMGGK
ncbi:hypothetical protein K388_01924 [Streptomyces sp. KhCrAH-43]|uniref:hypothetical protein n=1 Tax=unclassified Streptomyces TaxID=2593676 RepID=UPI000360B9AF|nr:MULTISPECIES: hypothetical protein [unclassified Streptomyces]MYS34925.1 hypothetical protein [Streptomyces sp. SID4920]MYX65298.1 hypothetical protein [Streptomyces sp. SID8373]RAJ64729.1 hypothetical protein K388_01924 [Streptomyces sp. KhCrAH-43]